MNDRRLKKLLYLYISIKNMDIYLVFTVTKRIEDYFIVFTYE